MKELNIYKNNNYFFNDAFDETVMNIHIQKEQNGYKSFTICGCEPGVGTTTVAINLATALANSGWKTVLVDCDMRKKNTYKRLNEEIKTGLSDFLLDRIEMNEMVYKTSTDNLTYIPCGSQNSNPVRLLCSIRMDELMKELENQYDYIIYDTPALDTTLDANVIAVKSDATLVVVAMGETEKNSIEYSINTLTESKTNVLGVIINRAEKNEYRKYRRSFDYFKREKYEAAAKKAIKKNKNK